jgi:phosphate transport system protein
VAELQAGPSAPAGLAALIGAVPPLLHDAFETWQAEDVQRAAQVMERTRGLEGLVREVFRGCFELSRRDPAGIAAAIGWHEVAGYLHRIAAHATNIAEMVIFLVRGQDVRHRDRLPVTGGPRP